ncbi:MAG: DUF2752 domain-containing protein, partial [Ruminiclostridium sp.]|nr:DUF2752 domain-containing protein [Ruminiclostridium sp.]
CPTCGTTRALISLLSLDFAGYFFYNPVAILYAVALALIIFDVKGKAVTVYYIATAILGVSVYLFRYFI